MAVTSNDCHVDIKLFTKQDIYSVPDSAISIPLSYTELELNNLLNNILESAKLIAFDFLFNGEIFRTSISKILEQNNLSTEDVLNIEYIESSTAPFPKYNLEHEDWVFSVTGRNNLILTGSYDSSVNLWNVSSGKKIYSTVKHISAVKSICWINDDFFISGSHDETILFWSINDEKFSCIASCKGHSGSVDTLSISPENNKFCSGSWDTMLKIWSALPQINDEELENNDDSPIKKKKSLEKKLPIRVPLMTLSGHNEAISSTVWTESGVIITGSWDHTLKFWDLQKATEQQVISGTKAILDFSVSSFNKSQIITASADRHVRLYDSKFEDGKKVQSSFSSHNSWVTSVAWCSTNENLFISGSYDCLVKMWDIRSPKVELYNLQGHNEKVFCVDWSIENIIASGSADNTLKLFSFDSI